jgi:hypothetical protein
MQSAGLYAYLPSLRSCGLPPLVALCMASWVYAQQDVVAPQPSLQLELAPVPGLDRNANSRMSLTGWSGSSPQSALGLSAAVVPPVASPALNGSSVSPGLDLGLRWRSSEDSRGRVNIGIWQHVAPAPDAMALIQRSNGDLGYDTRLEMQFSSATARGIQFELGGALGMQLNNNEKVVLRVSRGKPMVYYRAKF